MSNMEPIRERWAGDATRAGRDIRQLLAVLDRTRALLADAEAGLAKARSEHGHNCLEVVYWNDGEDERECELVKYHASPHFDGEFWFDDHRDRVPAPAQPYPMAARPWETSPGHAEPDNHERSET